jgi:hypothetical protein
VTFFPNDHEYHEHEQQISDHHEHEYHGAECMRVFQDEDGRSWLAAIRERPGRDYKGRYYFFLKPEEGRDADGVALLDVRWNSERTAERTLESMSVVELRRRLRSAVGRGRQAGAWVGARGSSATSRA